MAINRPALRTRSLLVGLPLGAAIAALQAVAGAGRSVPSAEPAAAEDTRARREERRAARNGGSHRRAAAPDLPLAGNAAGTARLVLRLPAAAGACVLRARGGAESAAEPGRDHRSGARADPAGARRRHRATHLPQPDRSESLSLFDRPGRQAPGRPRGQHRSGERLRCQQPGKSAARLSAARRRRVPRLLPRIEHRQHPFSRHAHQSQWHGRQRAAGNPAVAARSREPQTDDHGGHLQEAVRRLLQGLRGAPARRRVLHLSADLERRAARAVHARPAPGPTSRCSCCRTTTARTEAGTLAREQEGDRSESMAAILHRRLSVLLPGAAIQGGHLAAASRRPEDGPVAGHALVSRPQARLDRDQRGERHDRRVHHRGPV